MAETLISRVSRIKSATPTSGTHKFTKTTTIHNAPDATSAVVGTYNAGETVNYNGKLTVGNATWLRYQSGIKKRSVVRQVAEMIITKFSLIKTSPQPVVHISLLRQRQFTMRRTPRVP
ncbi:hypothetical protein WP50_30945 [Lactiplantibacillus plantarum]|nr:hypothetical protein WP50_30945 [Lactiplantibacillus plantarum]